MLQTVNTINDRYKGFKVRFSVTVYGSKSTTRLAFFEKNHEHLISIVNHLGDTPGPVNLKQALMEADLLFRFAVRSGEKVFLLITDTGNEDELITAAGDLLKRNGVILLSLNDTGAQMNSVTVTHFDNLSTPNITTDRPVVVAETILYKALQGKGVFADAL